MRTGSAGPTPPPARIVGRRSSEPQRPSLPLGELEAGAGATLAVLLALFLARVARQVAGLLQRAAEGGIDLDEHARHAVADRVRLAGQAAAADVHEHVEA